jgi:hypothetical protein
MLSWFLYARIFYFFSAQVFKLCSAVSVLLLFVSCSLYWSLHLCKEEINSCFNSSAFELPDHDGYIITESRAFQRRNWFRLGWEYALLFGQCGTQGTILFLTNENQLHSCRLSLWSHIGSVRGPISNKRSSGRRWIQGITVWRRSLGIYSTGAAGGRI